MSLVAVLPDRECDLAVLYASEVHYLVDSEYSFVTLELAIETGEDCRALAVVLDGVPPSTTRQAELPNSRNFRELLRISQCTITPNGQVWDFRDSFFDANLVTNRGYEGPDEWSRIVPVEYGHRVRQYGMDWAVPEFTERAFRSDGPISVLDLGQPDFFSSRRIRLRVGFFLTRRRLTETNRWKRWWDSHWRHRPRMSFVTRYFTYSSKDYHHFGHLNVINRLQRSSLALTLEPFAGGEYADLARTPTSDLWVVGYGPTGVAVRAPRVRLDEDAVARPTGYGLYTQTEENDDSPYWEAHFVPAQHIVQLQAQPRVRPRQDFPFEIQWYGELPGVTARRIAHAGARFLGIPAILLTLINVYAPDQAGALIPVLLALYLVIVILSLWAWHHLPALRRFNDS